MPLEEMRKKIDEIDMRIVKLLEDRVDLARKIGEAKRKHGLPIVDAEREAQVLIRATERSRLNKGFVKGLFEKIIEYSRESE